jgi:hypothetical protein
MLRASFLPLLLALTAVACGESPAEPGGSGTGGVPATTATTTTAAASTGATGSTGSGGAPAACEASFTATTLHLAVGASLAAGDDKVMCLRWTATEDLDISGLVGDLGPAGHHSLLMSRATPTEPDGAGPCSEAEIMDAQTKGDFQLLAGVSYESSGVKYSFPSVPVQVGLHVPKGAQLVFDAHFLDTGADAINACATMDLDRGKPVIAKLLFRTVLPKEEYTLSVPAHGKADVSYLDPVGGKYRIAAASSHMHQGGTHFKMSVKETGQLLFETTTWSEPKPALFDVQKIVVDETQSFQLDCSFDNASGVDQHFPQQMCVGGMYLLPCTFPGAC